MPPKAQLASPTIYRVPPPYERFDAVRSPGALRPGDLAQGSLLALGVRSPRDEWPVVSAMVPRLRARFPAAPVVLRVGRPPVPDDLEWVRRAGGLHVRAVLFDGDAPRARLQSTLTEPVDLPEELEEWLTLREPSVPPGVVHLIREIFRLAPSHTEISGLLAQLGKAERTVRTWFHQAGLPGPGKWLAAAHAVYAALRLQAARREPLLTVAVECGYSDHSSLSRQSLRLFGVRPGAIRDTLGWEWLMDRWMRRSKSMVVGL
jgi:AraC-like DNA-binding protein